MPTRSQFEQVLIGAAPGRGAGRVGAALAGVKVTFTGETPEVALDDAASVALMACGVAINDVAVPADADFANLDATGWQKALDIAELRLLETAAATFSTTVRTIGFDDFNKTNAGEIKEKLKEKRELVRNLWGYGAASLKAGSFRVGGGTCSEF